jgi:Putative peptidoglycan binding domain/N-acetylmuramoyl-L-alanine amidase
MALITRAQWGAPAQAPCTTTNPSTEGVAIHWIGPGKWQDKDPAATLRQVRNWHLADKNNNYCDIAYNLAVHGDQVFEARTTSTRPKLRTGANGNATVNKRFSSVLVLTGDGDPNTSDATLRAAGKAVAWLRKNAGAGPKVVGHRDLHQTSCPGNFLYSQLGLIAVYAASPQAPGPAPTPPPGHTPVFRGGKVYYNYLKYGNKDSDSVRNLQGRLIQLGYAIPAGITGNYFSQTKNALSQFQRAQGWSGSGADGAIGPLTAQRLFVYAGSPYTLIK